MNYKDTLNKIIEESGLSNTEILKRCKEIGITITPNYLSVLKNKDNKIPSEEVSRAIAQVCGANSEILVLQGYLDKAPTLIIEAFDIMRNEIIKNLNLSFELIGDEAMKNLPQTDKNALIDKVTSDLKNQSLPEFILEIVNTKQFDISQIITSGMKREKQWVLIPVSNADDVRIITENEANEIQGTK